MTVSELIKELETVEDGSEELDLQVELHTHPRDEPFPDQAPQFTRVFIAALCLPGSWRINMHPELERPPFFISVSPGHAGGGWTIGRGRTAALALCAAMLRAITASVGNQAETGTSS
jgi:hypothetical protein